MTWGAVGAAVVGAGVSYESSKKASEAAQAGQAQAANLTQQQLAQQQQQYQQLLGLSQPYRTAGEQALGQYQNLLQNPNAIYSDPTYQAMLNQGIQAVQANTAAQGTQMSGRTLAGLQQLGAGSHDLNHKLTLALLKDPANYEVVELASAESKELAKAYA